MELGAQLLDPAIDELVEARGGRARVLRGARARVTIAAVITAARRIGISSCRPRRGAGFSAAASAAGAKTLPIFRNFS